MAEITNPFSSANTTVDIYENSVPGQHTALTTLRTTLATALALALTNPAQAELDKASAYSTYNSTMSGLGTTPSTSNPSTVKYGKITITVASAITASDIDGAYTGTWVQGSQSGTWSSTSVAGLVIKAKFYLTSGALTALSLIVGATVVTTGGSIGASGITGVPTYTLANDGSITPSIGVDIAAWVMGSASQKIGKITAIGDTGVEVATIEVKLLNESGTSKDTGSSNEGTTTIDFLDVPADAGQKLMSAARNDRTSNKNRVFKLTHNSSGQVKWFVGIVSQIKTTEGAVDAMQTSKATILIQDGLTIV